ncbi:MAG TPA: polymer-forming cytoskeletal protein [Lachnospiraceae bacterium]|nr:polymer-forming cytoskeletal protein [Lachnospiraceae bacterium]
MGFFSELKEDLSQAVNELVPEEAIKEEVLPEEQAEDSAEEPNEDSQEEALDVTDKDDLAKLDAMLERLDSIEVSMDESMEEQETDLETSIREAFGEKEERKGEEKRMDVQTKTPVDETAVITAGMTVTGDIASEGSLELVGTINGNIAILGKLNITGTIMGNSRASEIFADNAKITGEIVSEGSVKIGPSSVVIGNIVANSAVIAGAVKGDIDVQGPVILDASAIVMGNIKSKAVQINNGAVIEGLCSQCYADVNPTSFFDEYKKGKKTNKEQ